jgi:hypothetical protein
MKGRDLLCWFGEQTRNYNLFIPNEDEYDDDNGEPIDAQTIVKYQRYATRLYVPLLIGK